MTASNDCPRILDRVNSPADVRQLSIVELRRLAAEIRERIIATVSRTGGHLAPSLGVVELTIALHFVFQTPDDSIVWDVGHQCYAHKIITGRARQFETLRQPGGISGFPKRAESRYDTFDTGHSGDSISVALGIAVADRLQRRKRKTVAVVGDGSIVTGMAFEALNHAGGLKQNLVIVLNDNEMSIAKSAGGFADYLNRIITGRSYNRLRGDVWNLLGRLPSNLSGRARIAARKLEEGLKNLYAPSVIFEELGLRYFGPFDGHNLISLIDNFRKVRELDQPILMHVATRKGKGYAPAEQRPEVFHGVGPFDAETGRVTAGNGRTFTGAFGDTLVRLAGLDERIVAISAGMTLGTGLSAFRERYPARFFDTGIAEQHAVAFSAGLARVGLRPVVVIYSTFMARAFDQIIQDVCLQNLPVVLALDRGGLVGEDGPTHHGTLDLSYLRCIPNLTVMAPADEDELAAMLEFALAERTSPIALRYPRGGSGVEAHMTCAPVNEGRGVVLRPGSGVALLGIGAGVRPALEAAEVLVREQIEPLVANMRFVKPLDTELLARVAANARAVFTVEENVVQGGFGSAVMEALAGIGARCRVVPIGLADRFIPHGSRTGLLQAAGLDAGAIARRVLDEIPGIGS